MKIWKGEYCATKQENGGILRLIVVEKGWERWKEEVESDDRELPCNFGCMTTSHRALSARIFKPNPNNYIQLGQCLTSPQPQLSTSIFAYKP